MNDLRVIINNSFVKSFHGKKKKKNNYCFGVASSLESSWIFILREICLLILNQLKLLPVPLPLALLHAPLLAL